MTMQFRKQFKKQSQAGYMQSNKAQIMGGETGNRKMITQLNKHQSKQAEMQGNEAQNRLQESEAQKMHTWQDKMSKTESQTGYMQSNKSHVMSGEKGKKEMQIRQNKIIGKMPIRQDRIIENQSHRGEMMIKNIQNKKENSKNELTLSEQYIHKKNIIETQSQSGRSMVEMLGVLAIIGVLSIGGIVGYKLAMNYYQANQIAHEMNIMRTDAKIKIAQGADELVLGNPYDDGNINFNNYETDFDCALADDAIIEENVSCRVANAFYIEMKNISQEICRPLSKLIQGMNELIGFEITTETIEADNEECQEGANNIHAVFSAEAISELKSCKEDTDCEEFENTPYCDKTRHVCVKCYEDNQCEHTEYCEDNTCKSCDEGLVWNGTDCKECTENGDCESKTDTPVCNTDINKCVECTENSDCESKPDTPKCDNNICKSCAEIDERTPLWDKDNNECKACPANQPWNGESCGCKDNNLCFKTFGNDYYCHKTKIDDYTDGETGFCKQFNLPLYKKLSDGAEVWGVTGTGYTYWNTCRLCEARAGKDGTNCSENGYQSPNMLDMAFFQCANQDQMTQVLKNNKFAYCHKASGDIEQYEEDNIALRAQEIQELITLGGVWVTDSVFDMRPIRIDLSARIVGRVGSCLYGHEAADGNHFPVCR